MLRRIISGALITGLVVVAAPSVHAQGNCAPREAVIERLESKYAERLKGGGLQNAETLLEVWASEKTGSFTVLLTHANGVSCIVSSGDNWNTVIATIGETSS